MTCHHPMRLIAPLGVLAATAVFALGATARAQDAGSAETELLGGATSAPACVCAEPIVLEGVEADLAEFETDIRYNRSYARSYSRDEVRRIVAEEALRDGRVPVELALALAHVESRFNAAALSPAGARGVMQIMPATARGVFGVSSDQLWNPRLNARLGVAYLADLYELYDERWDAALSHYNGGALSSAGAYSQVHAYTESFVDDVYDAWRVNAYDADVVVLVASIEQGRSLTSAPPRDRFTYRATARSGLEPVTGTWRDVPFDERSRQLREDYRRSLANARRRS